MVDTVAIMNAEAVSLMEHGDNIRAIRKLEKTVKLLAKLSAMVDDDDPKVEPEPAAHHLNVHYHAIPAHSSTITDAPSSNVFSSRVEYFEYPLLFDVEECSWENSSTQFLSERGALCIYNMALCHHREWCKNNKNNSKRFQAAKHLYDAAFHLLTKSPLPETAMVPFLALCTNQVVLHRDNGQVEEVRQWVDHIQHLLAFVDVHAATTKHDGDQADDQVDVLNFFRRICLENTPTFISAAAA